MKTCSNCNTEKPRDDFYDQKSGDGKTAKCKECTKSAALKYRSENLDRVKEYDRQRGQLEHRKEGVRLRAWRYSKRPAKLWRGRNIEKYKAHVALNNAIRSGMLVKPDHCEQCPRTYMLEGHHDDYSKPLEVQWLCKWCHMARHRELNGMRRQAARQCEAAE